ncbi:DNA methyltransferase [Enterococcus sp. HY326]|uniref:DNA methyltransferase n=1 Tax=Enterococcus sp. HY326 TaxID=2971265 RepID=UPI00223F405D|nr:DNA methyltransferase [Enterococcus sp. HY326]
MIIWGLFDSGNGCYSQAAKSFEDIEIYSIGIDRENKHEHFINLNLADYSQLFGINEMFSALDQLPQPDLIIASPPCESWSVASAMADGNASWKQEQGDSLFAPQKPLSRFTIRDYVDYVGYQFKPEKSLLNRINGELCAFNTIQIIKRYEPEFYVIENPATSKIWDYIDKVLGFAIPFDNLTYYNNYDYPISKPTKFKSNVNLSLKAEKLPNEVEFRKLDRSGGAYNARSNIPLKLVKDIFNKLLHCKVN